MLIAAAVLIGKIVIDKVKGAGDTVKNEQIPDCAVTRRLPWRRRPAEGDRGSGSLEFAVLSLAFLLLVFMTVQAALYYHARNVVKAEAEGTARAVRAYPTNAQLADSVPSAQQVQTLARDRGAGPVGAAGQQRGHHQPAGGRTAGSPASTRCRSRCRPTRSC